MITEKEFEVIKEISLNKFLSQRDIARRINVSLGLANLIIKRLTRKGYIKVKQLNRRKLQYILTPKGIAEKTKKSYNFTLKTIKLFKLIKEKICDLILNYHNQGVNNFLIYGGNNELADLTEIAIKSLPQTINVNYKKISFTDNLSEENVKERFLVLLTNTNNPKKILKNSVNLISYLSDTGIVL